MPGSTLLINILIALGAVTMAAAQPWVIPGGLTSLPGIYALGPTLLQNGDFEVVSGVMPAGWGGDSAWAADSKRA